MTNEISKSSVACTPENLRAAIAAAKAARGSKNNGVQPGRCAQCGAHSGKYRLCYDCNGEGEN